MGFQELIERCHNNGYKKLIIGKKPLGTPKRREILKKLSTRSKGFRLMARRKLKWRTLRRTLSVCCDILNRLKVDDAYPAIVFSSQWGLPVLVHPISKCRNANGSLYRKPANINRVVFA